MANLTTEELLYAAPSMVDTEALGFRGRRGDPKRHLSHDRLVTAIAKLASAPRNEGIVDLLVARGKKGERVLHEEALLTVQGGMPMDRWASEKCDTDFQLATARTDLARLVANGQPLELHGDNLFLTLDLSSDNLPPGSRLQLGQALVCVTPQPHNGCRKWVQRFGLAAMQLNRKDGFRHLHLRGIYLKVIEDGLVKLGDRAKVLSRAGAD